MTEIALCLRRQSGGGEGSKEESGEEEEEDNQWGRGQWEVWDFWNRGRGGHGSGSGDWQAAGPVTGDKVQTAQPDHRECQKYHPCEFVHLAAAGELIFNFCLCLLVS